MIPPDLQQLLKSLGALARTRRRTGAHVLGDVPILCISLPRCQDRRALVEASARQQGLQVEFVPGIDARPRPSAAKTNEPVAVPYRHSPQGADGVEFVLRHNAITHAARKAVKQLTYAELGCTLAHLLAMRRFLDDPKYAGADYCLVTEDDVGFEFTPWWPVTLAEMVAQAPADWQILHLQTDAAMLRRGNPASRYLPAAVAAREHMCSLTPAYCVSRAGARALWERYCPDGRTFDFADVGPNSTWNVVADRFLYNRLRTYTNCDFAAFAFAGTGDTTIGIGKHLGDKWQGVERWEKTLMTDMTLELGRHAVRAALQWAAVQLREGCSVMRRTHPVLTALLRLQGAPAFVQESVTVVGRSPDEVKAECRRRFGDLVVVDRWISHPMPPRTGGKDGSGQPQPRPMPPKATAAAAQRAGRVGAGKRRLGPV